jgi:hypothetical protein
MIEGQHLMATNEEIRALANLISYSVEADAVPFDAQEVVILCLRMAAMAMTKAIAGKKAEEGTGDVKAA